MVKEAEKIIFKNPLQAIAMAVSLAGVCISLLNFYVLTTIQPLVSRLEAVEKYVDERAPLLERFIVLEETVKNDHDRLIRVETKIDKLLEK